MLCCAAIASFFLICLQKKVKHSERAGLYITPYTLENTPSALCKATLSLILNSAFTYRDTHFIDVSTSCVKFCLFSGSPVRLDSALGRWVGAACMSAATKPEC